MVEWGGTSLFDHKDEHLGDNSNSNVNNSKVLPSFMFKVLKHMEYIRTNKGHTYVTMVIKIINILARCCKETCFNHLFLN